MAAAREEQTDDMDEKSVWDMKRRAFIRLAGNHLGIASLLHRIDGKMQRGFAGAELLDIPIDDNDGDDGQSVPAAPAPEVVEQGALNPVEAPSVVESCDRGHAAKCVRIHPTGRRGSDWPCGCVTCVSCFLDNASRDTEIDVGFPRIRG